MITRVRYSITLYNITYDCSYTDKVYVSMCMCMYMCVCMCVYICVCMCVYIYVYLCMYLNGEVSIGT